MIKSGDVIQIKGLGKRMRGIVVKEFTNGIEDTFIIKSCYKPAPKSQMRRVNAFAIKRPKRIIL